MSVEKSRRELSLRGNTCFENLDLKHRVDIGRLGVLSWAASSKITFLQLWIVQVWQVEPPTKCISASKWSKVNNSKRASTPLHL
jgi:hypothetical protein